jgi:hypothetical protein
LTTVFLTLIPPGSVVPETRNCALEVLSNPLPATTTTRLTVP